jgi:type 1 glutamine amidotransferase
VLVFTKTDGVRRPSIKDGVQTIRDLARDNGFRVTVTHDSAAFAAENPARFRSSFTGGTMGYDHPVAWCQDKAGGRSWYTGLGHSIESYRNGNVRKHLLGGIE